ncbi:hypothetical protein F4808DRAFT_323440 [Astrocystis sublimbata]|nr:hypothetical protein F4808DRAFT_323440 [Astrocystis sublimbata]
MADPLSIAGLVTGVISLGLQTASGLSDYLDAVRGRDDELDSTKRQATNMVNMLLMVQDLLPELDSTSSASANLIKQYVQSCNEEIGKLHALLSELCGPASSNTGFRLKLAKNKQKLEYPFNRPNIRRLEERVAKVNGALQTALQTATLNVSIATNNQVLATKNQVQQLHDLLSAMLRSQSQPAQRTTACLLSTTSTSAARISQQNVGLRMDSPEAAASLAGKPSLLSTAIETVTQFNTSMSPPHNQPFTCTCSPSRDFSSWQKAWGSFSFTRTMETTRKHLPGCPVSRVNDEVYSSRIIIEYDGMRKLLQKAFVVSFTNTRGAGGGSISPNFAYYPIVDRDTAPAFRIMQYLVDLWSLADNVTVTQYDVFTEHPYTERMLRRCFDNILILYSTGRASPRDTDDSGQTLMHYIACVGSFNSSRYGYYVPERLKSMTLSWVSQLIEHGVPLSALDDAGSTACADILQRDFDSNAIATAKLLMPRGSDVPLMVRNQESEDFPYYSTARALSHDLELAEAAGCGPLGLAAIAGDEAGVRDILRRHPESLNERNQFGLRPAFLATKHPACLRLILEAHGSSMADMIDPDDDDVVSLLSCACSLGSRECVQLILEVLKPPISVDQIAHAPDSCQHDLILALKHRRDELKQLALENMTWTEAESLKLHESATLDAKVLEVLHLLQSKGVNIPPRLYGGRERKRSVVYNKDWHLSGRIDYDQFWALDFRDIDCIDPISGGLPTMEQSSENVRWLIEHGADYWTPFSERIDSINNASSLTPAHFIMAELGRGSLPSARFEMLGAWPWLAAKLLQIRVGDNTSCSCTVGVYTPLKAFVDGFTWFCFALGCWEDLVMQCVSFIEALQGFLRQDDIKQLVRQLTFEALKLTHTCSTSHGPGCYWRYSVPDHSLEEIGEINSEQSGLLSLFSDLLDEFEEAAFEEHDGRPLIFSDPKKFWMDCWLPRIRETLEVLDGADLTPDEIAGAEAIGVVWKPMLPVHTREEVGVEEDDEDEDELQDREWEETVEEFMRDVEEIMNE